MANNGLMSSLDQLENTLDDYLGKKAPQLPANVKEIVVKLAPWLTLIGVIIAVPGILLALGLGSIASVFAPLADPRYGVNFGVSYTVSMVILVVAVVLEAMAVPGLFNRSRKAWKLLYWATLVSLVSNLVTFNLIGGLLGALVGFYFLFQVRSYYK